MKKIRLLFAAVLSMMAWTGAVAQTEAQIDAANAAITDNGAYRIYTQFDGSANGATKYYLKADGYLTDQLADAKSFKFNHVSGGTYAAGKGYRLNKFTNGGDGSNNITSDAQKHIVIGSNDRDDFEGQVFFLDDNGYYAIRSTNSNSEDWAASAFWTVVTDNDADGLPNATYTMDGPQYIWSLELDEFAPQQEAAYNIVQGWLTKIQTNSGLVREASKYISNAKDPSEGSYEALLDGDYTTYFHSTWHASNDPGEDHYLQAELSDAAQKFQFYFKKRSQNNNNRPTAIVISASNDGEDFTEITTIDQGLPTDANTIDYLSDVVDLGAAYNYVRFTVPSTNNGSKTGEHVFFTFSEFYVLPNNETFEAALAFVKEGKAASNLTSEDIATINQINDDLDNAFIDVTYQIKFDGRIVATEMAQALPNDAPALPNSLNKGFVTYSNPDIAKITRTNNVVTYTATWAGPFEISADYANAHWYDMAMRNTWYVTSDKKDADGAYSTVNADATGLVKDAYLWAFVGNPFEGIKVLNKAAGEGYSFGYTDAAKTNAGIPTIMADNEGNHSWNIVASTNTSVPANSFCLNVPGTNLYINQFGGAGGSVKFWNSAYNVGDAGSAFTVFDVPTNFAEFTGTIEALLTSEATGYFTYNEATRALWKDDYKTNCPYDTYVALQAAVDNRDNIIWPATGYYRIKSANYDGRYVTYADVEGTPTIGTAVNPEPAIANIVKLTALGDKKYNIAIEGLNVVAPAKSQLIRLAEEGAEMTAVVTTPGVGTFTNGEQYGALHCASSSTPAYYCVGWTSDAAASQWIIEDIADFSVALNAAEGKSYATFNAPFGVTLGGDVKAYAITLETNAEGDWAVPTEIGQQVPANTPVLLVSESAAASVTATINDAAPAVNVANVLKGTNVEAAPSAYVLNAKDGVVGFYALGADGKLGANKAYLEKAAGDNGEVKALKFDIATAIKAVNAAENASVFNLAGQRVNKAQKGIYIVNGKKVVK